MDFFHKIGSIGSKLGADEVKYDLNATIHYVSAKLNAEGQLKVVVKRGADKKEETQAMQYDATQQKAIFEYPVTFFITMYRKGDKFGKKDLSFRMVDLSSTKKGLKNGKATVEFQDLALTNGSIIRKEFPLKGCTDKKAVICISISLSEAKNVRSQSAYIDERPKDGRRFRERVPTSTRIMTPEHNSRQNPRNATFVATGDHQKMLSSTFAIDESYDEDYGETVKSAGISEKMPESPYRTNSVNTQDEEGIVSENYYEPEDKNVQKKFIYKAEPISDFDAYVYPTQPEAEKFVYPHQSPKNVEIIKNDEINAEEVENNEENQEENQEKISVEENKPKEGLTIEIEEDEESEGDEETKEEEKEVQPKVDLPLMSPRSMIYRNLGISKENIINPKDSHIESEASSSDEDFIEVDQEELMKAQLPLLRIEQAVPNEKSKEKEIVIRENGNGIVESRNGSCAKCILF